MGLALPALRLIAREYKKRPFTGPILTIGRQCIYATEKQIIAMLHQEGLTPHNIPSDLPRTTNIPAWRNSPYAHYTNDHVFFTLLTGVKNAALDVSDYEGAEYVWDLNKEIPNEWHERFGTVIDSGSLEHVFDSKQALINMNSLTKKQGIIIHLTPANNYLEHGFYQFSPTLFMDYYGRNNFQSISCLILEQSQWHTNTNWNMWEWDMQRPYTNLITKHMTALFICAKKGESSTTHAIPQQGDYSQHGEGGRTGEFSLRAWQKNIIDTLPEWTIVLIKRVLGRDLKISPWGLVYKGRV